MADNLPLNAGTGGKTVRTFQDTNTVDWPSAVICYVTALGTPDVLTVPLAAALTDAITNPTTIIQGAANLGYNGTTWDRLRSTTANGLVVDVSRVQGTIAVDASATTQPISAASLPLPTGAATAAKQPALGIAGTAASDVITVQGIASMTALKVDGSAVTQPVSGTVTALPSGTQPVSGTVAATQSGTWTMQPGNTANTTAWKVDASATTQPISAASLPLPSGASTAAKQPALGTAGTASTDVITVQGIASMTALKVDASATTQPVSGTVSIAANSAVNVAQMGGTNTDMNSGVKSAGTQRIVIATDQPALTNALKVDGSAVTQPVSGTFWQATQPVSGTVAATQSGTWNVGTVTTVTTVAAVTAITNALPAGTNLIGQVSASHETGTIYNGATALTPKFAKIVASTSGATTVVALVTSKKIRVLRWSLSANGIVNVKWQSAVTPTDLTGLHYLTQYASAGGAYCPAGIFETIAGEALSINLSAAIAVGGELTYVEV